MRVTSSDEIDRQFVEMCFTVFEQVANDVCLELRAIGCTGAYAECEEYDGYKIICRSGRAARKWVLPITDLLGVGYWINGHMVMLAHQDLYAVYKQLRKQRAKREAN